MQNAPCYLFVEQCDVESWLSRLVKDDRWQPSDWQSNETTYYDTFDWRLHRREATLELNTSEADRELAFQSLGGDLLAKCDRAEQPGFAWDLPEGQLRQHLEPLIKMRRLLPQVTISCSRSNLALLNKDRKTVLRMTVDAQRQAIDPQGNRHPLPSYLQILPVRGYESAIKRIDRLFSQDPFLQPTSLPPLTSALAALGRCPNDYSSKLDELALQPTLTAQQALQTILQHLLTTLRTNIDGTCSDIDSEFLHDLRVSVRRTRSALSQLKGLLPAEELAPFREGFAWMGNITGPTRDLDVYLLKYAHYVKRLPENHRQNLAPFHDFLIQRQAEEQQTLAALLQGAKSSKLLEHWQDLLDKERDADPALPDAELPVKEVVDRRIWKLFRRCVKEGRAITSQSPAEHLHELRKTCKKLRYLLEFFQSLYPPQDMTVLIKALKVLQDNLGDFNDFEVQSEAMHTFGLQMAKKKKAPPETLLAMGMLAESLRHQQQQTRQEFECRFAEFCADKNRLLFRKLFNGPKGKEKPPS